MLVSEIIGNIGADAEIKEFSGKKYVSFSVAHSEYGKDQQGSKTEQAVWISVLWYGEGGGLLQYLKKGAKVFVRGRQRVKLYTDRNGHTQYAININAGEVVLCGSKAEGGNEKHSNQSKSVQMEQQTPSRPIEPSNELPF